MVSPLPHACMHTRRYSKHPPKRPTVERDELDKLAPVRPGQGGGGTAAEEEEAAARRINTLKKMLLKAQRDCASSAHALPIYLPLVHTTP